MRKPLNSLLLIIAFAISTTISAQADPPDKQVELDSLHAVWQDNTQADSTRVAAYSSYIGKAFLGNDPDSMIPLAQELLAFGDEKRYPKAKALAYRLQALSYQATGDYSQALANSKRCLDISEEIGYEKGVSNSLIDMGSTHYYQGNYPQAVGYYQKALKIAEEDGDKRDIAGLSTNIGVISMNQGNNPQALEYYQRGLKINEEMDDKLGMANSLNNIGNIYLNISDLPQAMDYYQRGMKLYEEIGNKSGMAIALSNMGAIAVQQRDYPQALNYCQSSLRIREEIGDKAGQVLPLWHIGSVYDKQGDYPSALDYYGRSLKVAEEGGDKRGMALALGNMGEVYNKQMLYARALDPCRRSLDLGKELEALAVRSDACHCLYEANKGLGNGNKALEYHERMVVLNDSLKNDEKTKKIAQLEMQYDFDKKEAATQSEQEKRDAIAMQELERQKLVRNGFMGGFAVVLLFAGVFFTQRNRISKEKARSEELLLNILPEEVAEELKAKGSADAVQIDQVTVLFTDFKGFTVMAEQMSAKDLVQDLNICFSEFDRIMEKHGIEKIKTIGDAYMAAGGLPTPNTTHASDVIKAAFEMRDFVESGKARKIIEGLPFFEIRIGIHTGPVVAGIVGVKKFQYDIWGDTVNTASRMESSGEVGQVNISEATYALVKDEAGLSFTPRGKVQAKGKGEMEMYFVERSA